MTRRFAEAEVRQLYAVDKSTVDGAPGARYYERADEALGAPTPALTTTLKGQHHG